MLAFDSDLSFGGVQLDSNSTAFCSMPDSCLPGAVSYGCLRAHRSLDGTPSQCKPHFLICNTCKTTCFGYFINPFSMSPSKNFKRLLCSSFVFPHLTGIFIIPLHVTFHRLVEACIELQYTICTVADILAQGSVACRTTWYPCSAMADENKPAEEALAEAPAGLPVEPRAESPRPAG